ncbi:MAG: S-layer homology domain-containing protein [Clostridiales bacterium]|nr:S-layer homology domain-containing protein [Clostridiales bacterium]
MKHTICALLAVLLILVGGVTAGADYTDTRDLTAAELTAIEALSDMQIFNGYPDGSFRPLAAISRAEFAKVLCLFAAQDELAEATINFTDVLPQSWYRGWLNRAVEQGWLIGYPGGEYRPQNAVTQQEIAGILVRLAGRDTADFTWPDDYIDAARAEGLFADITFSGAAQASRLIACQMLYNLHKQQEEAPPDSLADLADGLYLGVVESCLEGADGVQVSFWHHEGSLTYSVSSRRVPVAGTLISYTVKAGRMDFFSVLLDFKNKTISSTTALTRTAVPEGPYTWAFWRNGAAWEKPVEFKSATPTVIFHSYRNLTVGQTNDNTNYWMSDSILIYTVNADGEVKPGDREALELKQQVIILADKNAEIVFLFILTGE